MEQQLLETKFDLPPTRASLVIRPRLISLLDAALPRNGAWQRRLTLVSAPAGYGKSTLLSVWCRQAVTGVSWISLEQDDNDPARFLAYLNTALQRAGADIEGHIWGAGQASALPSLRPPAPLNTRLTALINELASVTEPVLIVLDDYHVIEEPQIHEIVGFLLDHLPQQIHFALATRADPPLPLARLRSQGLLTEVNETALRFSLDETATFFNEGMGLQLTPPQIQALEKRTEGWIAGLQLAALALRGQGTPIAPENDASAFIRTFTGSHQFILDYLTEEVLNRQSTAVHTFLTHSAILDRLCGPLCVAVTGQADSQQMLEVLERANLFIVPLDAHRHWYRYHHLFADLLRQRLQRENGDIIPELHRRASSWYEAQGLIAEAVRHALSAGEGERVAEMIEKHGWALLVRGEMKKLLGWLDTVSVEQVQARPDLGLLRAWALAFSGRWDELRVELADLTGQAGQGGVTGVRAYMSAVQGDWRQTVSLAEQALAELSANDLFLRAIVNFCLGITYFSNGRPVKADRALTDVIRLAHAAGQPYLEMTAIAHLGHAREMQGLLHQALETHQEALRMAQAPGGGVVPFAGIAHVGIAELMYEWNDLDAARHHAREGVRLTELGGFTSYWLVGYACLAQVHLAQGEVAQASEIILKGEQLAHKHNFNYLQAVFADLQARLCAEQGKAFAVGKRGPAHRPESAAEISLAQETDELVVVRWFAAGAPAEKLEAQNGTSEEPDPLPILNRLLVAAETAGRGRSMIRILAQQAVVLQGIGEDDAALTALERALTLAEQEGFVRTFVDTGPPMARLLRQAAKQGIWPSYTARLLAACGFPSGSGLPDEQPLVEPLTERELEVLNLIATGRSNREIAQDLVIAVSTVKSHINNIYGKLGVKSRTQAVARSQSLKLI